ncbi:hypothetical protein EBR04_10425, partial [bacterium]|nr:hypothetical protein [bacterium]
SVDCPAPLVYFDEESGAITLGAKESAAVCKTLFVGELAPLGGRGKLASTLNSNASRSFVTGEYERYAEVYFTTHEPGGRYGNVTIRGNVFTSGPHASQAITFAPGGDSILVADNIFRGPARDVVSADGCTNVEIRGNLAEE